VIESYDGFTSYLLVVDEVTKYAWLFLTKSKDPPLEICRLFFKQFGNENGGIARVDQGGELARSEDWRSMMLKEFNYIVEPTGATLLYGADLPAKYWSAAALHAVYLMNRRVHSTLKRTPFEAWWDRKPDLSSLRTFGSRVCVKVTGKRNAKLDRHDFSGIFIGYTATDDNIR
jgi:hypothetical protein